MDIKHVSSSLFIPDFALIATARAVQQLREPSDAVKVLGMEEHSTDALYPLTGILAALYIDVERMSAKKGVVCLLVVPLSALIARAGHAQLVCTQQIQSVDAEIRLDDTLSSASAASLRWLREFLLPPKFIIRALCVQKGVRAANFNSTSDCEMPTSSEEGSVQ